jgi:competence CoiA-like predicted nuclease
MVESHPLSPRNGDPSDPLVACNNADGQVVAAEAMIRGNSSYYDLYGYQGSKDIVCIDCKQDSRDVPVILVEAEKRRLHFRHKQGEAPDGLGRHGETAEHLRGRQLITDWARDQRHVLPWSVEESSG